MDYQLLTGDCRTMLDALPAGSVQCVVTSPPYFGLRDYQVDGQIGLEQTPDAYVAELVDVFRKVRRVLRDDGTLWLNLGDSYYNYRPGGTSQIKQTLANHNGAVVKTTAKRNGVFAGIKDKDLIGIPWRVAFALQADGWWLRSDIIWHKPNPMPESVTDRPTKAHEYIFLLTKSERYFYDAEAVKEGGTTGAWNAMPPIGGIKQTNGNGNPTYSGNTPASNGTRNRRSVWTVTTKPYSEAHFATYPPELPELCILAGTSAHGQCARCGAPYRRVVERGFTAHNGETQSAYANGTTANRLALLRQAARANGGEYANGTQTTGWAPSCTCGGTEVVPQTVLDPFAGSGTTLAVALSLGRRAVGVELNPAYVELAHKRITRAQPALFGIGA